MARPSSREVKLARRVVDGRESPHVGLRDSLGLESPEQDIHELGSDERANRLALGASHVRPERLRAVVRRKRFEQPPPACGIKLQQASLDQDAVFISWSDLSKRGERWIIAKPFCLETRF